MCDTIVALGNATASGHTLFGKNSDRERNEAQAVEQVPACNYAAEAELACTYITIPQARRTHAVLLCRPFWLWGAEMGANAHGVAIGNEAVYARTPPQQDPALIGMDLLRLGLERAETASEALEVITGLLARYGQGGSCGHLSPRFYDNSFLIADRDEAYVLETAGRLWAAERVRDVRSISNAYSIGRTICSASPELAAMADAGEVDFAASYSDDAPDAVSQGRARCARSTALLERGRGALDPAAMMAVLRDHGGEGFRAEAATRRTICMHAGAGERRGQTVGSLVSDLATGVHWVTASAAPCLSVFKPALIGVPLPAQGPRPTDRADAASLWWRHEDFHRAALADLPAALEIVAAERDALEDSFRERLAGASGTERASVVADCWAEAEAAERRWAAALGRCPAAGSEYESSWTEHDRLAGRSAA